MEPTIRQVEQIREKYNDVIKGIEDQSIGFKGSLLKGRPFYFEFPKPIEDFEFFIDNLFNYSPPFNLWGIKTEIDGHDNYYRILAVDLHSGDSLNFEISQDMLRCYLYKGSCGNTILRLYTNLQLMFNHGIKCKQVDELVCQ